MLTGLDYKIFNDNKDKSLFEFEFIICENGKKCVYFDSEKWRREYLKSSIYRQYLLDYIEAQTETIIDQGYYIYKQPLTQNVKIVQLNSNLNQLGK